MLEIPHQYLREVKSKQFLLMIDDSKSTPVATITICNHCKTNQAEIFQDNGDYCIHCWQEITCPNV